MTFAPRRLLAAALLASLLPLPARAESRHELIHRLYYQALEDHDKKKDYPAYYAKVSRLAELLPTDAEVICRLAGASALTGRTADAERLVKRLATLQAWFDLAGSPDFAAIRKSEAFRSTVASLEALKKTPVGTETVAFRLPEKDFIPEAVAWDAGTRSFLLSSIRHRKVVRLGKDGAARELVPEGKDGLWSASGIGVD